MKKILFTILVVILLSLFFVFAQENHENEIEEGKKLVQSSISCNDLTEEQLEAIGEYYMEQMHPGEAHKIMDNMMGGEGSESLKQVHINMAKRLYCNDKIYIGYGMMGSGGMMNMMNQGIIGNYPSSYASSYNSFNLTTVLINVLLVVLITAIVVWLVKLLNRRDRKK